MSSITTVHVQIARTVINLVEKKIVTLLQRTLSDDSCKPKLRIRNNRLLAKDHANRKLHEIAANAEIKIRYVFAGFLFNERARNSLSFRTQPNVSDKIEKLEYSPTRHEQNSPNAREFYPLYILTILTEHVQLRLNRSKPAIRIIIFVTKFTKLSSIHSSKEYINSFDHLSSSQNI